MGRPGFSPGKKLTGGKFRPVALLKMKMDCGRSRFDPRVWLHSFVEIGHGIISTAIISQALIQVGQLSVTGEKMCS